MKIRHFIVAAVASAMVVAMSGAAFAKDPDPIQQNPMQGQQQQVPVKPAPPPGMHQGQQGQQQQQHPHKVRFIRVHRGDTLSGIAHRFHMRVATLKRLNHLRSNTIFVGQRLRVR
jgi:nucleoid-associated protein YgaU